METTTTTVLNGASTAGASADTQRAILVLFALAVCVACAAALWVIVENRVHEYRRSQARLRAEAAAYHRIVRQVGRHADAIASLQRAAGQLPAVTATHRAVEVKAAPVRPAIEAAPERVPALGAVPSARLVALEGGKR